MAWHEMALKEGFLAYSNQFIFLMIRLKFIISKFITMFVCL